MKLATVPGDDKKEIEVKTAEFGTVVLTLCDGIGRSTISFSESQATVLRDALTTAIKAAK